MEESKVGRHRRPENYIRYRLCYRPIKLTHERRELNERAPYACLQEIRNPEIVAKEDDFSFDSGWLVIRQWNYRRQYRLRMRERDGWREEFSFRRDLRTTVSKQPVEHATGSKTRDQRVIMSAGEDVSMCPNMLVEARPSPTSIRSKGPRKYRCILDAKCQPPGPGLSRRKGGSQEGQQPKDSKHRAVEMIEKRTSRRGNDC
ncbi:hypothetical protein DFH08DRAFT_1040277 [Mycena albidolilacea]|uniref:Uncharacterized protein n=1 Tax=Mycena albidolilacea TaxID=1033008 RepID=A0AAD7EET9_9AGAR|nr:hypothetical protein DFH08DRAFT_1040277 [Mycena albidolilacea]